MPLNKSGLPFFCHQISLPILTLVEQWVEMYAALNNGFSAKNFAYANLCLYKFLTFFFCQRDSIPNLNEENQIGESIAYMKSNIDKILSVEELADLFNYSCSHFSTLFKNKTGLVPIEYFIKLKFILLVSYSTKSV